MSNDPDRLFVPGGYYGQRQLSVRELWQMGRDARAARNFAAVTGDYLDCEAGQVVNPPDVSGTVASGEQQWVQITSNVRASGRYPGKIYLYDSVAETWTVQAEDIWVVNPNDASSTLLKVGVRYRSFSNGTAAGRRVFVALERPQGPFYILENAAGNTVFNTTAESSLLNPAATQVLTDVSSGMVRFAFGGSYTTSGGGTMTMRFKDNSGQTVFINGQAGGVLYTPAVFGPVGPAPWQVTGWFTFHANVYFGTAVWLFARDNATYLNTADTIFSQSNQSLSFGTGVSFDLTVQWSVAAAGNLMVANMGIVEVLQLF